MTQIVLLALGAGGVSALLALSFGAGSPLGLVLSLGAALPLLIVGLGWHWLVAALGALFAGLLLVHLGSVPTSLGFMMRVGVPAALFAWALSEDARGPRERSGTDRAGFCLLVVALYAALAAFISGLLIDSNVEEARARLAAMIEQLLLQMRQSGLGGAAQDAELRRFAGLLAPIVLPLTAMISVLTNTLAVYVAARVVRISGRLPWVWRPLWSLVLPRALLPFSAVLLLMGLLPGQIGFLAELLAVALLTAITLLGFATLHAISIGFAARGLLLTVVWISTLILGLPALLMFLVGVVELSFGLRARMRPPPAAET